MNTTTEESGRGMAAGQQVASAAAEQAGQVSQQAAGQAKEVAGTVAEQARQVGQEATAQARSLIDQTKDQAHQQAETQTQQLVAGMGRLGDQARALLAGQPAQAGSLPGYADNAVSKVEELTRRLQDRGFDGITSDVQGFARRRPGAFLVGAAALGFGIGRLLRAGAAQQPLNSQQPDEFAQRPPVPAAVVTESSLGDMAPAVALEGTAAPPSAPPLPAPVDREVRS